MPRVCGQNRPKVRRIVTIGATSGAVPEPVLPLSSLALTRPAPVARASGGSPEGPPEGEG
ncbi:hypothetical protein GCM10023259_036700 [Thermocatellispora tengchongensis]